MFPCAAGAGGAPQPGAPDPERALCGDRAGIRAAVPGTGGQLSHRAAVAAQLSSARLWGSLVWGRGVGGSCDQSVEAGGPSRLAQHLLAGGISP